MGDTLSHGILADALHKALMQRKPDTGVMFHSDRGTQYASYAFRELMERHGFVQSMSSSGNCYDNALMESFFHTLKSIGPGRKPGGAFLNLSRFFITVSEDTRLWITALPSSSNGGRV